MLCADYGDQKGVDGCELRVEQGLRDVPTSEEVVAVECHLCNKMQIIYQNAENVALQALHNGI